MNESFLKYTLTIVTLILSLSILAQTDEHKDEKHEGHDHHKNEIGIANAPVYFIKEKVFAYGLHIHYVQNIAKSKFGIGLGYERIFDEHKHNTFGLVVTYRPIDRLSFNVSPGLTIEDGNSDLNFAVHLETSYEFEIENFHIGPVLEFAYDPEDIHLSLGLHVGYGF